MNRSLRYGTKVPPVEMTVHVTSYVSRLTSLKHYVNLRL